MLSFDEAETKASEKHLVFGETERKESNKYQNLSKTLQNKTFFNSKFFDKSGYKLFFFPCFNP